MDMDGVTYISACQMVYMEEMARLEYAEKQRKSWARLKAHLAKQQTEINLKLQKIGMI